MTELERYKAALERIADELYYPKTYKERVARSIAKEALRGPVEIPSEIPGASND